LRERKRRVEKPFAIMVPRVEDAARLCVMDKLSKKAMNSFERPIVLLPRRAEVAFVPGVAPGNRYLGVFLPYTPLHHLLFQSGKFEALVMTSGNLSEEPIAIENEEAARRLNGIADSFLVHDREIVRRCDDSVVRVAAGQPQKLRRSRGFVPVPVHLEKEMLPVLAVGGELKNTVCVVRGSEAFLSQHVGDLENLESYRFFEEAVQHLQRILETEPKVIAHIRRAGGTARDAEHAGRERSLVVEFVQHAPLLGERSAHRRARDHQQRHRIGIRLRHGGHDVGEARPRDHEGGRRAAAHARESIRSKTGALFVPHQHVADLRRGQTAIQFQVVHAGNAEHGVDIVGSQ